MKDITKPGVGDTFIIINRHRKCKNTKRVFVIKSHTFGTVTYDDTRTNNNCVCNTCDPNRIKRESLYLNYFYPETYAAHRNKTFIESNINKQVSISNIKIIERKLERQREIALKLLLGKGE